MEYSIETYLGDSIDSFNGLAVVCYMLQKFMNITTDIEV